MAGGGVISRMRVFLGLDNKDFKKGLKESEKKTSAFGNSIKKIGTAIAGAFAVKEIGRFVGDLVKLAGEAEGVQRAFDRIGGNKVFDSLKAATRGTVSNLELMRKTVTAKNLGVPVKDLAKLFEFAAARAADTGESVDFLVNSIVVGIGRKSPLILDNLGISAIALKEKMEGVGIGTASVADVARAVSKIATEELDKIGTAATTNGQKLQSVAASWDNIKLAIGRAITASKEYAFISDLILGVGNSLDKTTSSTDEARKGAQDLFKTWKDSGQLTASFIKKWIDGLEKQKRQLLDNHGIIEKGGKERHQQIRTLLVLLKKEAELSKKAIEPIVEQIDLIKGVEAELKVLKETSDKGSESNRANINKQIEVLKNYLALLKQVGTTTANIKPLKLQTPADLPSLKPAKIGGQEALKVSSSFFDSGEIDKNREAQIEKQQAFVNDLNAITAGGFATLAEFTGEFIGAVISGDAGLEDFFSGILGVVGDFVKQFGEALIAYGIAQIAFKKAFANPAGAIAAGVALVAIGSVISSLSAAGPGGSSSGGSVTSIDTRGNDTSSRNANINSQGQAININVQGVLKGTDIALSAKQGNKQLAR